MNQWKRMAVLGVAAAATLTACDDDDDLLIPEGESEFAIVMEREDVSGAALMAPTDPSDAVIGLDLVSSIELPIGAVEARQGAGDEWVEAGSIDAVIDLMALPGDGVTVLDSDLPEGEYTALRFWLIGQPTITLTQDVMVGRTTYEAGEHPLVIPSADQAGVRLSADFDVDEDGQVLTVLFDGDATVRHVTATGAGVLKIAPVLRVENEAGEDVGGIDDDEDDEGDVELEGFVASATETGFTLEDGTEVRVTDETELEGDILSLVGLIEALAAEERVEVEVEGVMDGDVLVATEVEFEIEDADDVEVEGLVIAVDRAAETFTIDDDGESIVVVVTAQTEIDRDGEYATFDAMADAFEADLTVFAEAEGEWDPTADNELLADEVEFDDDDD